VAEFFTRRNQLHWLALLAIAFVLPTVSLLWFMSRVIANERLVVRQKLAVLYQDKLADANSKTEALFAARIAGLDQSRTSGNPYAYFRPLILENHFQGVVVWDAEGTLVFPQTTDISTEETGWGSSLAAARQAEFAERKYDDAAERYDRLTGDHDRRVAIAARAGKSRCLSRLGRLDEAIGECQKAALETPDDRGDTTARPAIQNARLLLLSLLKQSSPTPAHAEVFRRTVEALVADLYSPAGDRALLPPHQNCFIAQKVLEAMQGPFRFEDNRARKQLEQLVAAESLSLSAAGTLHPVAGGSDGWFQTTLGTNSWYCLRHRNGSATWLVLMSEDGIASVLSGYRDTFAGSEAAWRILNAAGDFVAGTRQPAGKPFNVAALPDGFPNWKVELYFEGSDVFEKAAKRQIAVYAWTGALVILLILTAGVFATRAVSRQIRLNEMKNDFIATVSHELKTPLASMRVLVDTLLEGRVRDEAQTREYLRLTAKENERLSRMIDNFLTFSRMERNKQAFTLTGAAPAAIARDAAESVQTKFATHHCQFALELAEPLPEIVADHDAIVTVLVNLLDNACKYTSEQKRIALKVFAADGFVCFAVSDNGIGLARRHLRRIFDRFYQVDSSLARKAEGCGLGLSIVKFIVDAHKGRVSVDSKPGQGSTFIVRLPVANDTALEPN
jgi:signal transduction histidine kinase